MTDHLKPEQLEAWAVGTLPDADAKALEAHADGCDACAALLKREAKLEVALTELAQRSPRPSRRRRTAVGAAVAVAALAAAALAVVTLQNVNRRSPAPTVVHCEDPASEKACIQRAHFDGLLTVGPGDELTVPRYDLVPGGTP